MSCIAVLKRAAKLLIFGLTGLRVEQQVGIGHGDILDGITPQHVLEIQWAQTATKHVHVLLMGVIVDGAEASWLCIHLGKDCLYALAYLLEDFATLWRKALSSIREEHIRLISGVDAAHRAQGELRWQHK